MSRDKEIGNIREHRGSAITNACKQLVEKMGLYSPIKGINAGRSPVSILYNMVFRHLKAAEATPDRVKQVILEKLNNSPKKRAIFLKLGTIGWNVDNLQ